MAAPSVFMNWPQKIFEVLRAMTVVSLPRSALDSMHYRKHGTMEDELSNPTPNSTTQWLVSRGFAEIARLR